MVEQLVMALLFPERLCRLVYSIGAKVGRPQLPGLPSGGTGAGRKGNITGLPWSQLRREQTHRCWCLGLARLL